MQKKLKLCEVIEKFMKEHLVLFFRDVWATSDLQKITIYERKVSSTLGKLFQRAKQITVPLSENIALMNKIILISGLTCNRCHFIKGPLQARADKNNYTFEEIDISKADPSLIE